MKSGAGLRRLALLLLLVYLAVALAAAWWTTVARQGLIEREDNPRRAVSTAIGTMVPDES